MEGGAYSRVGAKSRLYGTTMNTNYITYDRKTTQENPERIPVKITGLYYFDKCFDHPGKFSTHLFHQSWDTCIFRIHELYCPKKKENRNKN